MNNMLQLKNSSNTKKATFTDALLGLGILLLTIVVILWPFAAIWSINTLFNTGIPYTFWTWLAGLILYTSFQGTRISNKGK